jgi:hypothetical protein
MMTWLDQIASTNERARVAEHGYVEGEGMIRWTADFVGRPGTVPMINRRILGEKYGLEVPEHYVGGYLRSNGFNCAPDVICLNRHPMEKYTSSSFVPALETSEVTQ